MIPNSIYDIVSAVNRELDLSRPPVRDHYHRFGSDGGRSPRLAHELAHPARPRLIARLTAAIRSLARQRPKTGPAHTG